jgi:hypothetical protein
MQRLQAALPRFFADAFDPGAIERMSAALSSACRVLGLAEK